MIATVMVSISKLVEGHTDFPAWPHFVLVLVIGLLVL